MNIGDPVYIVVHGLIRFGTIRKSYLDEDGWVHYGIEWVEDEMYKGNRLSDNRRPPLNIEEIEGLVRCDLVTPLDLDRLSRALPVLRENKHD